MEKKLIEAQNLLTHLTSDILEKIPFCQMLGLKMEELTLDHVSMSFKNKPELIGNFVTGVLHGGVISSVLDNVGGAMAMASIFRKHAGLPFESFSHEISKTSTVDLRVDYLQPGLGDHFIATARALRTGKRICVASMNLHNNHKKLIAVGTAAYLIS